MTSVVVSGALASKPWNGGAAWTRLSYVLGFRRLGFDTYFIEQLDPAACVDRRGVPAPLERSTNLAFFDRVIRDFGLDGAAAVVSSDGRRFHGASSREVRTWVTEADLLVNIGGNLTLKQLKDAPRQRVFVDPDPGFTQFWHGSGSLGSRLEGHDHHFSTGTNIGSPGCSIPTGGIRWRPTVPPVVLDLWPPCPDGDGARFTTVGTWRGPYGPIRRGRVTYGLKLHEFRRFLGLPGRVPAAFEVALDLHPADQPDRERLTANGWRVVEARSVAGDPGAFRSYLQCSGAEFSAAQGLYVQTRSGWFSDRTARYLASGKPALVQDTGFGRTIPVGEGLIAFRTMADAESGAARILADYHHHRAAARALAERYFDSDIVLGELLETALVPA